MARTVQKSISSSGDSIETMEDHPVGTNANISTEDGKLNQPYNASVRSIICQESIQSVICLLSLCNNNGYVLTQPIYSLSLLLHYTNHYVLCKLWSAKILGRQCDWKYIYLKISFETLFDVVENVTSELYNFMANMMHGFNYAWTYVLIDTI